MKYFLYPYSLISLITFLSVSVLSQDLERELSYSDSKWVPFYNLKKAGNTSIFQGNKEKKRYFEGWYFKMVSEDETQILSVIPGIALSDDGLSKHAFIQFIDGKTAETKYFTFPVSDFSFSKRDFSIRIGRNYFSKSLVSLDLEDENSSLKGTVEMDDLVDYKSNRLLNPGIMGWYRFVPFMECYHGVVSLNHNLKGQLNLNGITFNFNNGKGYIEKDWGKSMPSCWIWMQSNNFRESNSSFMLSVADVPWLGKSFTGFLGFLYYKGELYNFATYRNTKLNLEINEDDEVVISLKNRKNTFIIIAKSKQTGLLNAPLEGSMDRRIPESIDASVKIEMYNKKGTLMFTDSSSVTGLEMVGDYKALEGFHK